MKLCFLIGCYFKRPHMLYIFVDMSEVIMFSFRKLILYSFSKIYSSPYCQDIYLPSIFSYFCLNTLVECNHQSKKATECSKRVLSWESGDLCFCTSSTTTLPWASLFLALGFCFLMYKIGEYNPWLMISLVLRFPSCSYFLSPTLKWIEDIQTSLEGLC